jgi:hypothetical protein
LIDTLSGFGNGENIALPTLLLADIGDGKGFDAVRFVARESTFEFRLLVPGTPTPIPLPAGGLLLLGAVGALAAWRWRKTA